jgi:hypothetical protein
MSTAEALDLTPEPIIIYRSVNHDGQTFGLAPSSRKRLREHFGEDRLHLHPRVFVAHETADDYDSMYGDLARQVVQLLTGLSPDRLQSLGGVMFRDPVTEHDVPMRDA